MGKILIFGATGMLGSYLKEYLRNSNKEVYPINRARIDASVANHDTIVSLFRDYEIAYGDVIINCMGIIPQSNSIRVLTKELYYSVNTLFPIMLSTVSYMYDAKFIHITTDCVFSGSEGNYNELDMHTEENDYGVSKSLGENGWKATIIRTSIIGEEEKNNYSLLEWVRKHKNETLKGYKNHMWNGVTCLQLAKIINTMIDDSVFWVGVRHIFSPRSVSKYELVSLINEIYDLNNEVVLFETPMSCDKTLTSIWNTCQKFNIPDLQLQLHELQQYKDKSVVTTV